MKIAIIFLVVIAYCHAIPKPQNGNLGAELSKNQGAKPNLNVFGNKQWGNDRGSVGVSGNHRRELGGLNRHQTNIGVRGSYDVFKSKDGRTRGTVFGGVNRQWNSHGPNRRSRHFGARFEHRWGRK